MSARAVTLLLAAAVLNPLGASDLRKLPEWARPHALAAMAEKAPEGADAWVLFDRTEMAYTGGGEIRTRHFRLVRVLGERGIAEGAYTLRGIGAGASKVTSLKGWNLREDGDLVKLDPDKVVTYDADRDRSTVSTGYATTAVLPRVAKDSLVAFESQELSVLPIGPVDTVGIMEDQPIRRWELSVATNDNWFVNLSKVAVQMDLRHFAPWIPSPEVVPGRSLAVSNVPARPKDEAAHPDSYNVEPWVLVKFLDPALAAMPSYRTWDTCAASFYGIFAPRIQPSKMVDLGGKSTAEALQAIHRWMCARLSYKQVYLSPERGWVPETGPEVVRRGYGDCKDLTTCFLGEVKGLGQGVYPALARIIDGAPETDDPVGPIFNHVISAIHLEKSLGFHSEVETSAGRLLLVDPTDRLTPLGWLGVQHLGHRVLVCMEKGGVWVDIPDGAILRPSTEVRLEGEVAASGRLAAILTLKETGDHLGLRGQALLRGKDELKQRLSAEFELPPTAKLELVRSGEPLDLTHPFEVVVKIEDSDGFHHAGSEASLASWGLPRTPALIQKTGQPRRFPVSVDTFSELDYSARIITDQPVSPVVPELKVETALRSLDWSAKVLTEQGRNQLDLHFHQARKPAHFGFGEQEKGVAEAKKDRRAMQAFRADALAFKVQP